MNRIILAATLLALATPGFADGAHTPAEGWNEGGGKQDEALGPTPDHENRFQADEV